MKKEELYELIGEADEKAVADAGKPRTPNWVKWGAVAACLALVITAVVHFVMPSPIKYETYWLGYHVFGAGYSNIPGEYGSGPLGYWQSPDAKQTVTITINGEKIQGTYKESGNGYNYLNEETHYYTCEKNGEDFSIDSKGNLVSYSAPITKDIPADTEFLTEAECLEIAKKFIRKNVNRLINFDNYELSSDSTSETYRFRFIRHIRGYATTEQINITICKNGDFWRFSSCDLGAFKIVPKIDEEKAKAAAIQKLDSFYKDKNAIYKDFSFTYTILKDGTIALICTPSVKIDGRIEQPPILIK